MGNGGKLNKMRSVTFPAKDFLAMTTITHDGVVHNPLGAASHIFAPENSFVSFLSGQLKDSVKISIGAQPNSAPHFGTLVVFSLAFSLGKHLNLSGKTAEVVFDMIDTARSPTQAENSQLSLRDSNLLLSTLPYYEKLLKDLSSNSGVSYQMRRQIDFNSLPEVADVVHQIVSQRTALVPILDPVRKKLRIRVACPVCNLSDKKAQYTDFVESSGEITIISRCSNPDHPEFRTPLTNCSKLEYNTPLRNLVRALAYSKVNQNPDKSESWLRVTGSDYAGSYQEHMLYKSASLLGYPAHDLPIIVYAPLIVDWSGAKLSKSVYLAGAYTNLPDFVLNLDSFYKQQGEEGISLMFEETCNWLRNPKLLFRHYSVYYILSKVFKSR